MTGEDTIKICDKYSRLCFKVLCGVFIFLFIAEFFLMRREFGFSTDGAMSRGFQIELQVIFTVCLGNLFLSKMFVRLCLFDIAEKLENEKSE